LRSRSNDAWPDCSHAGSGIEPYGHFSLRFSFRLTRTVEKGHLSNVQAALSLARALVFGVASDAMAQQAMYEQMVFPTRFVWGYGGKQVRARPPTLAEFHASQIFSPPRVARPVRPAAVAAPSRRSRYPRVSQTIPSATDPPHHPSYVQVHLCGSFTNWLETVPMAPEPTPNGGSVFAVVCNLPPGYHQYKFIVDGEWRHDENQAFIQDPLGNVNNW